MSAPVLELRIELKFDPVVAAVIYYDVNDPTRPEFGRYRGEVTINNRSLTEQEEVFHAALTGIVGSMMLELLDHPENKVVE